MNPFVELLFILLPISVSYFSNNICIKFLSWGFVIAPISTGLYSLFFIPYIGIVFLPFLPISLMLNRPSWWLMIEKFNILHAENLTLLDNSLLLVINGIIWGFLFYIVSCIIKLSKSRS